MKNENKKKSGYNHLSQFERDRIEVLIKCGTKLSQIADIIGRNKSTISREIKRNSKVIRKGSQKGSNRHGARKILGDYVSSNAQHKAYLVRFYSKFQWKKINYDKELKNQIVNKLKLGWSPDAISGKLKIISKNAIYKWLYGDFRGQKYTELLFSQHKRIKRRRKNKTERRMIPNRIGIEMRPESINLKINYGDYEGDTIVSGKKTRSKVSVVNVYERKAKFSSLRKIKSLKPKLFNQALEKIKNDVNINSLTLDNGIENKYWEELGLENNVYFCQAYHSWEKPGVENSNRLLRRFIPKGIDISKYSDETIFNIEYLVNNIPRKSLNYQSPYEVMKINNQFKKDPYEGLDMSKIYFNGKEICCA